MNEQRGSSVDVTFVSMMDYYVRYVIGPDHANCVPWEARTNSKKEGIKGEGDRVHIVDSRQKGGVAFSVTKWTRSVTLLVSFCLFLDSHGITFDVLSARKLLGVK